MTGGSGYIGSCLVAYLNKKYKVYTLDKKKKNIFLNKKIIHFKCDLNNEIKLKKIIYKIQPDTIVHLAGQSTIDMVDKKINEYIVNNTQATNSLLKIIRNSNVKKFIFSSTASVYKNSNLPLSENMLLKSNNSYGRTKIINEKKIIKSFKNTKIKYCILRFFNVSGCLRKYKIGEFHSPETHLTPIIINSFLKNKKISIYGNQYKTPDGTCIRDYIHIDDVLKGITKSIKYLEKNKSTIFNLGSGTCYSVMDIISNCAKILKKKPKIKINKIRKYDSETLMCKISKAKQILNWSPKKSNLRKIIEDELWWFKYLKKKKFIENTYINMRKNKIIKIVGDIMLDEWFDGKNSVTSTEAPINIFDTNQQNISIGGSGNLCLNLKKLNVKLKLFTEIGKDINGNKIINLLKKKKIHFSLIKEKKLTTTKRRLFINKKQIFRQDTEDKSVAHKVGKLLLKNINHGDTVIISDYKKGVIHKNLHSKLIQKNCLTFIDPKNHPSFYKEAFLIKPNMNKFNEWCGKFTKKKAYKLLKKMKWTWLVVTASEKGVHVFNKYGEYNHYKVKSLKAKPNVIGAGDIFFCGLIYFFQKNYSIFNAVALASHGSTECVKKESIRYINKKDFVQNTVFTNGVFDILHNGHLKLLRFAKKIGKKLIVGLNSDKSTRLLKGKNRPYNNLNIRIKNLKKTKLIDQIYIFDEKTPLKLIKKIKPDVIIKGNDYKFQSVVGSKISNIMLFEKKDNNSTTKILKKIRGYH